MSARVETLSQNKIEIEQRLARIDDSANILKAIRLDFEELGQRQAQLERSLADERQAYLSVLEAKQLALDKASADLQVKEIKPWYFPVYVEDLAAVRAYLDQLNDHGDLNSSSIYIIGAEDTAALGFLWMAAEWNRPGIHPLLGMGQQYKVVPTPGIINDPEGGRDVAGAIWLSASVPALRARRTHSCMRAAPMP